MDLRDKVDYDYSTTKIERCEVNQTYAQELSLRDYILDIEERIFNADFGDAFEDENERKLVSQNPNRCFITHRMAQWMDMEAFENKNHASLMLF